MDSFEKRVLFVIGTSYILLLILSAITGVWELVIALTVLGIFFTIIAFLIWISSKIFK